MKIVNLSSLACFDTKKIALLNSLSDVNQSLMPHTIAGATGCRLYEAMALLLYLYGEYLVNGYLLVYHDAHVDFYVEKRPIGAGLPPKGEYFCQICEESIDAERLFFDFEFIPVTRLQFTL